MTVAPQNTQEPAEIPVPEGYVRATIDGFEVVVPKGELIIRAAERIGIEIPRFCDHPLLDPIGACRQCIVEVEGQRKPMTSCTTPVGDGMVIKTQLTSRVADKAQKGTMELLLINHPLDCPICDKGGECPLQNQAMSNGRATSRFRDIKRTYPKPIAISSQVLLDRERCVLCARCTRFSAQVSGDPFIELFERGALEQVAIYADEPYQSYFSGNVVQICPVGALTGASYRFRARPFDLVSTPSVCEHCASGCAQRTDWRRGKVTRRLAGQDPAVNEEWNCDKGRWAFTYVSSTDRLLTPLVRAEDGVLEEVSWPEALERAAEGLREARDNGGGVGVLPGGRLTLEDAYAYAKFARVALATNDIDMRARPHSAEELDFLASHVVRSSPTGGGVSYADLEQAPAVLLVGFEPEEESPIVFLRLRKAFRQHGTRILAVAPYETTGLRKCGGTLLRAAPGTEPELLDALVSSDAQVHDAATALRGAGAVILVGERLATVPGGLSAAARLAAATGAKLGWVPRRAGERGAVEAGALPNLLPGGRPVADPGARAEMEQLWGVQLPGAPGRDLTAILTAARDGELSALVVGGVELDDLPDPALAEEALSRAGFVVSLELMESRVTDFADVVFPVAPAVHKAGTYVDWEGRQRPFPETVRSVGAQSDGRVLDSLALELGADIATNTVVAIRQELAGLPVPVAPRPAAPSYRPARLPHPRKGEAVLSTWHLLLDCGTLQQGEPHLAGTAKRPWVALSPATAAEIGATAGGPVTVSTEYGAITLPLQITDLPDRVVWLPTNSAGSQVRRTLRVGAGAVVGIGPASEHGGGA